MAAAPKATPTIPRSTDHHLTASKLFGPRLRLAKVIGFARALAHGGCMTASAFASTSKQAPSSTSARRIWKNAEASTCRSSVTDACCRACLAHRIATGSTWMCLDHGFLSQGKSVCVFGQAEDSRHDDARKGARQPRQDFPRTADAKRQTRAGARRFARPRQAIWQGRRRQYVTETSQRRIGQAMITGTEAPTINLMLRGVVVTQGARWE